ncbi:MAG: ABC transporter permease [Candidatus Aminicenantes bacterium]|nr:MAG: ABC transporter permease [Candidatus Aminicenantes bacterium]
MRKILSVIKREYLQIVRTKGFIIGTIIGPILMAALIGVPIVVQLISVAKQETVGVIDASREIFEDLNKKLDQENYKLKDGRRHYILEKYEPSAYVANVEELRSQLSKKVLNKELSAYLFIPADILKTEETESKRRAVEYVSQHTTDFEELRDLNGALNNVVIGKRLKKEGLDPLKITQYIMPVGLKPIKVTKRGEEEDTMGTFFISYFLALVLYMALFIYGAMIMRGVIEEKTSRVVEVILSSLRPFQLMVGKILGIGAVGLTQFSIWALFGFVATRYSKSLASGLFPTGEAPPLPSFPPYIFIYFVIFFILGYFLYGTLYATIGSMVNSEKEAQQLLFPITMFLIIPILLMILIIRTPDSSISVALSLVPFFTPILMLLRVCVLLPPFVQVGGSILLLALTVLFMIWLASKIYRVGILMYGKPPNLAEIVRWIRYK